MSFWPNTNKCNTETIGQKNRKQSSRFPGWCIGLCLGIVCLTVGLFNDQFTDIMQKAVMICLECIGIG